MIEHIYIATTDSGLVDIVKIDSESRWIEDLDIDSVPEWVMLENDMCDDCKYLNGDVKYCKAATGIFAAVNSFSNIMSIERISLTTITSNALTSRCVKSSEGLSIMFLSCLVFSGCYKFRQFKWAWDFYKSQADDKNIFYNIFSSYVSKKIILGEFETTSSIRNSLFDELKEIYKSLRRIIKRVRKASEEDANLNALVRLTSMTHMFQTDYQEYLDYLKTLVKAE